MSDLVGLYSALSGLRAAQAGIDTATNNLANVTTPGYTRQRVDLASRAPAAGLPGTGVDVAGVSRARDEMLDARVRSGGSNLGALATRAALLESAEQATGEPAVWVETADAALQGIVNRLQRAGELAVRGANTTNASDRGALAAEVLSLRDEIVELANTRHLGRGLFAGYALDDAVTYQGGVWAYTGDHGLVTRRVDDGPPVTVSVTAHDALGFGTGSDALTMLDDLAAALQGHDDAGIAAGIDGVAAARDRVTAGLATLGIAGARLEAEQVRIDDAILSLRTELSGVENVDLAETVMELQLHEAGYEAALAAFARSRQASLVDFLR